VATGATREYTLGCIVSFVVMPTVNHSRTANTALAATAAAATAAAAAAASTTSTQRGAMNAWAERGTYNDIRRRAPRRPVYRTLDAV